MAKTKKKLILLLTIGILLISCIFMGLTGINSIAANADSKSINLAGAGTEDDPYIITNSLDFKNLFASDDYAVIGYYKLNNDIDFYDTNWNPKVERFVGTLDGNGKTIKNINIIINTDGNYGLFRYLSGTVKNLTVDNLKVTSNFTGSFESIISVGAIAGEFNGGEIINCTVKNSSIDTSKIKSETFVGGFAGYSNYGLIENCKFGEVEKESATSVYGNDFVGGFVGFSSTGTINDCINYGTVKCGYAEDIIPFVGGIAGEQSGGAKIVNSCNVGIIKYAGDKNSDKNFQPRMGQLLGTNASGSVYNTLFTSNIGTVSSCQGTVDKGNLRSVGGFLGIGATNQAKYVSSGCVGEE